MCAKLPELLDESDLTVYRSANTQTDIWQIYSAAVDYAGLHPPFDFFCTTKI